MDHLRRSTASTDALAALESCGRIQGRLDEIEAQVARLEALVIDWDQLHLFDVTVYSRRRPDPT